MSKVWIAQRSLGFDYSPAEAYGDLHFVIDYCGPLTPDLVSTSDEVQNLLDHFQPEDYFILTGSPLVMSHVFALLYSEFAAEQFPQINVLVYDKDTGKYHPVSLPVT